LKDYYKILEIEDNATIDDIKKSYRKLAVKFHPDKNPDDKEAEERFKDIAEAYSTLSDPEKKSKYDLSKLKSGQVYGDWGGMSMEDIFEDLKGTGFAENFDKIFGGAYGQQARGSDVQIELNITLEDVYLGCFKSFSYFEKGHAGTSTQSTPVSLQVHRGVMDGQKLRIKHKGHAHPLNSQLPKGDLIVTIRVINSSLFKRNGNDIYYKAQVPFYTALLGGDIYIPGITSGNKLKVKIPELTQQGKLLKLKSKGLPIYDPEYTGGYDLEKNADRFGDMIIEVNIVMPEKITAKEKELFEQLKKLKESND
jgi:curved DNA-binding protein